MLVALDGDGASTFLITISALLPVYKRLGMRPLVLAGVVCLGAGVMNMVPWGGPTARAMAALHLSSSDMFIFKWAFGTTLMCRGSPTARSSATCSNAPAS